MLHGADTMTVSEPESFDDPHRWSFAGKVTLHEIICNSNAEIYQNLDLSEADLDHISLHGWTTLTPAVLPKNRPTIVDLKGDSGIKVNCPSNAGVPVRLLVV